MAILTLLLGCGGGDDSGTQQPITSGVIHRVFVSNIEDSTLHILDADRDLESFFRINVGVRPGLMALSPDKNLTLVLNGTGNTLSVVDNQTEQQRFGVALGDVSESFVVLPDNETAFVAVRNTSSVLVIDITEGSVTSTITVPSPRRLALSHNGSRLLVFSDDQDNVRVIDTEAKTVLATLVGFSRPVAAVFSSDDSRAYVMSCGEECDPGGGSARVVPVDMTTNPPTVGAGVVVSGATVGLLDGNRLYVAGSPPGATCSGTTSATTCGRLDVLDVPALTVARSAVEITDGFHDRMELASNGRLYIGAVTCTNLDTPTEERGCLSIYNTATETAVVANDVGDVTGIAPLTGRNVVYVVIGGEVRIYDTTTDLPQAIQIFVSGRVVDVKEVD